MQLIGSLTSPYVRKVRVVLAEKKLDYHLTLDNVWADDTRIQDFNPLGKVPCLLLDGGEAVFDSRVIVEYLDTLSPVGKLLPATGRERAEAKTWEALADGLLDAALAARMERTWVKRADSERSQAFIDRQLAKIASALAAMERGLGDQPHCLGGAHLSLADIAVVCALDYLDFRFPELAWAEGHPNLVRLQAKLAQRPSFIDTLPQ
ncbi:glutathione S-transferase [Comamonas serinivorans]|uniref:Glutathione S-transferase n=1 Tax=Comamonas serinivorans TaxID=1082851 RepID=A0A1Y0ESC4_9BURK|nr:glutathione S-transferase C-terminal domain-containing protein [Comamonas serinivorans]ARU06574.1 glutathione S-transferase [Comamonas serinivorans]